MLPVFGGQNFEFFFCLKSILKGLNHIYIFKKLGEKILSKKTIVKVRGYGQRPYFRAF